MQRPVRLSKQAINQALEGIQARIDPLERFVNAFASSLPPPILYDSGQRHVGYRFATPGIAHFCLLKLARCVSALNAMAVLARAGYSQEICVLVRTIAECTTQIEFVLCNQADDSSEKVAADGLVEVFFQDFARNSPADFKRSKLRQGSVHASFGESLDAAMSPSERSDEYKDKTAEQLLSNVYLTYSNYVHCKYPETMDLFGGLNPHFHLRGMSDTPKDYENLEIISTFVDSVALSVRSVILQLRLRAILDRDTELKTWFDEGVT